MARSDLELRVTPSVLDRLIERRLTLIEVDRYAPPEPSATVEARPAPLNVRVTRVAGRMRPQDRDVLADKVGAWVNVIIGVIFVVCVLGFRKGVVGELDAFMQRRRGRAAS